MSRWTDEALRNISGHFLVQLKRLEHGPLAERDLDGYAHTVSRLAIDSILGRRRRLLERSLGSRIINRLSGILTSLYRRGLSDSRMLPRGHSVTVVFERVDGQKPVRPNAVGDSAGSEGIGRDQFEASDDSWSVKDKGK